MRAEDKSAALRAAIRQHPEQQRAAAEEASKAAADKRVADSNDYDFSVNGGPESTDEGADGDDDEYDSLR